MSTRAVTARLSTHTGISAEITSVSWKYGVCFRLTGELGRVGGGSFGRHAAALPPGVAGLSFPGSGLVTWRPLVQRRGDGLGTNTVGVTTSVLDALCVEPTAAGWRTGTVRFPEVSRRNAVAVHPVGTREVPSGGTGSDEVYDRLLHSGSKGDGCQRYAIQLLSVRAAWVRSGRQGSKIAGTGAMKQVETVAP